MASGPRDGGGGIVLPFLAGLLTGAAGAVLLEALYPGRRGLDPALIRSSRSDPDIPATVVVPGILGSELVRSDGGKVWLNLGNAFGSHDLRLPTRLPFTASRDGLIPAGLLGVDRVLPRLFGFTEYADLVGVLERAGFVRDRPPMEGAAYYVFTYDWRRDLVESARALGETLAALAASWDRPDARFNLIGHSMGGLVARYFLRYGGAEPGGPVTWAGAHRVARLVLGAVPSAGSLPALDSILNGSRVGLSTTTLSAEVVWGLPSVYQLLPPREAGVLMDSSGATLDEDLHDRSLWERRGWGPFGQGSSKQRTEFVAAALERGRVFHEALARAPDSRCPSWVSLIGGDCLPTLGRAVVDADGPPRFEPESGAEAEAMFEAGDGRVTRASALASFLATDDLGCGIPEVTETFLGAADHHGLYGEATFQSIVLRRLLRPVRQEV
jgi:pimeloyl-ACP methyl ester carboxylesterase